MSTDSHGRELATSSAEPPGSIVSAFLRKHRDAIIRAWETRATSEDHDLGRSGLALRDDVAELLDALANWLAGDTPPEASPLAARALDRVMQRLDEGLALTQLLREYRLLRETILDVVLRAEADAQERPGAAGRGHRIVHVEELAHLNTGLDVVLSQSIDQLVSERDRRAAAERSRAEALQRENQERLEFQAHLLANAAEAMAATDEHFLITYWNRAAEELLGWTAAEVLGRPSAEVFRTEVPGSTRDATIARLLEEGTYQGEVIYRRRDGRPVTSAAHISVLRGPRGEFRGTVTAFRDVTARVNAEMALRRSEARFRAVQDNSLGRFTILEPVRDPRGEVIDFSYVYQNAQAAQTARRRPEELVGRRMTEVYPSFPRTRFFEIYKQVVESGQARTFEERYELDGVDEWFRAVITPVPDGIAVATELITDRKRAEEALRREHARLEEESARLRALFEALPAGVAIADANGKVLMFNEALTRIWGGPPVPQSSAEYAEWRGWWRESGERLEARDWAMARAISRGEVVVPGDVVEIEKFDGSGRATILNAAVPIRDARGEIIGGVLAQVDVTAQRRAEDALRESEARERHVNELFNAAVAASPITLFTQDCELRYTWIPQPAPGYRSEEMIGKTDYDVLERREDADAFVALKRRALATNEPVHDVLPALHQGVTRWYEVHVRPQRSDGKVVGVLVAAVDITERKVAEEQQAFLLKLSDALRPITDPSAIQVETARLLRERFDVGWCYYAEFDEAGTVATILKDAAREGLPSLAGRHDLTDLPDYVDFLRTGQLLDVSDFANYELLSPRVAKQYTALGVRALLGVALIKEGRLVAQLVMADTLPRRWPQELSELVREVAERTWAAVERARAQQELSRMRQRADEVNAFRVRFSDAVEGLTDPNAVARAACRMIREELGAERAYWADIDWTTREWVVGGAYDGSEAPVIQGRFPLDAWEPFTSYHLEGRPVVVCDTQRDARIPAEMRDAYAGIGVGADLGTAVLTGGKLRAVLTVNQRQPRRWTDEEIALVRDVAGRCWAAVERARAEEALRETNEWLKKVLEVETVGVMFWDMSTGRMTDANGTFFELMGYSRHEVEAGELTWRTLTAPEYVEASLAEIEKFKVSGRTGPYEKEYVHKDGTRQWFVSAGSSLGGNTCVEFFVDISDRKRAEAALKAANDQLIEADRAKSEFLAVLSHELRNPLAPIANSLYILDHAAAGGPQAERAKQVIGRQVGQLSKLVNDLLDVTRITRKKVRIQKELLELNEVVRRAVEDNRSLFEQAGVHLEMAEAPHPVPLRADPTRLTQIVGNLLQNSAKFTSKGGHTQVSVAVEGTEAVVRVTDDGVGMSRETLDRLFQPFSQAEQALDRSKGGLGLGLALVRGLVELHGGSVAALSEGLGRGAEMIVRLPLDTGAALEA